MIHLYSSNFEILQVKKNDLKILNLNTKTLFKKKKLVYQNIDTCNLGLYGIWPNIIKIQKTKIAQCGLSYRSNL